MQTDLSPLIIGALTVVLLILILLFLSLKSNISKGVPEKDTDSVANNRSKTANKIISIILFIIGGLPLLIYPFVMLANIMSLAGFAEYGNKNISLVIFVLFLISTSTYPLTYIVCLLSFFKKGIGKIIIPIIPLLHILLIVLLYNLWNIVEKSFE